MLAVWALFAAAALAVVVTYARLPPGELYNTSVDGIPGGLGRALVFLNFPTALVAIGIALVCADRLARASGSEPLARFGDWIAAAVAVLGAVVVVPGVVDQADLDAKMVNAVPALGVALALALTLAALGRGDDQRGRLRGDALRVGLAAALVLIGIPWLFAETGFYAPDPVLADERPEAGSGQEETLAAVHLGHHHGTDGVLLGLSALALSRTLPAFRRRRLQAVASAYVALMLAYGIANAVQDFWLEQIVKRGWTSWEIPSVLRPEPSLAWAAIVAGAVLVELAWFRRERAA